MRDPVKNARTQARRKNRAALKAHEAEKEAMPLFAGQVPPPELQTVREALWKAQRDRSRNLERCEHREAGELLDLMLALAEWRDWASALTPEQREVAAEVLAKYPRNSTYVGYALKAAKARLGLGPKTETIPISRVKGD